MSDKFTAFIPLDNGDGEVIDPNGLIDSKGEKIPVKFGDQQIGEGKFIDEQTFEFTIDPKIELGHTGIVLERDPDDPNIITKYKILEYSLLPSIGFSPQE